MFNNDTSVELLRIKDATFALVFKDRSNNKETINQIVQSLPECNFDPDLLWDIQLQYKDISNLNAISFDDAYSCFSVNCENYTQLFSNHKRQCIKSYRSRLHDIFEESKKQIRANANNPKVCMHNITEAVFQRIQSFSAEKPKFIANLWLLGNTAKANQNIKNAFEAYTRADESKQKDQYFCAEKLCNLFTALQLSIQDSFKIHYLDHIASQLHHWYFVEPELKRDFMIFVPDSFTPVQEFLLDMIDTNPFVYYIRENGGNFERLDTDECCLDSDNLIFIPEELLNDVKCFRELSKLFDEFYNTRKALQEYGMFDCQCYDLTPHVPPGFSKDPYKRKVQHSAIEKLLVTENQILEYSNIIHDKFNFIRHVVKPQIIQNVMLASSVSADNNYQLPMIANL